MSEQSYGTDEVPTKQVKRRVIKVSKKESSGLASAWNDPWVRILTALIALAIIGSLATIIFALINGTISLTSAPLTASEAALNDARANLAEDPSLDNYSNVIISLGESGRFQEAYLLLDEARGMDFDVSRTQGLEYAYGSLLAMERKNSEAETVLLKVMNDLNAVYEEELARGGDKNWAMAYGIPENYLNSALILGDIYEREGRDTDALNMYNIFLEHTPTAADIIIARGNVKLRLGDNEGALEDFNDALRYLPDSVEALRGISQAEGN